MSMACCGLILICAGRMIVAGRLTACVIKNSFENRIYIYAIQNYQRYKPKFPRSLIFNTWISNLVNLQSLILEITMYNIVYKYHNNHLWNNWFLHSSYMLHYFALSFFKWIGIFIFIYISFAWHWCRFNCVITLFFRWCTVSSAYFILYIYTRRLFRRLSF